MSIPRLRHLVALLLILQYDPWAQRQEATIQMAIIILTLRGCIMDTGPVQNANFNFGSVLYFPRNRTAIQFHFGINTSLKFVCDIVRILQDGTCILKCKFRFLCLALTKLQAVDSVFVCSRVFVYTFRFRKVVNSFVKSYKRQKLLTR
jgi:hypothetical protein